MKTDHDSRPPQLPLKFFRWFCHPDYAEDIEGDLLERYDQRQQQQKAAGWLLVLDVIRLFRPGLIRKYQGFNKLNNFSMFLNFFKTSLRSIMRHKTFSFLNIAGLSIGLASCILILIYINNELSYDKYNKKYEDIYRVVHHYGNEGSDPDHNQLATADFQVWGSAPVAPAMMDYFPEVETFFRFTSDSPWLFTYKGLTYSERDILFADSTAFSVFDWPMLAGNPKTALVRPNTIVLSKQLAEKYFGDENPIGKSIRMDNDIPFEVTGVTDVPANSHFSFNGLISMSTYHNGRPQIFDSWGYVDFYTYFVLKPGSSIESMRTKIADFIASQQVNTENCTIDFEPLADAYLRSTAKRQPGPTGNLKSIYIFGTIALFILIIACINFMNLSTARSVERAKEVAIRKTIGSHRGALIGQFLTESVLVTLIASIFAGLLVYFGHSLLERVSGKTLPVDWLLDIRYLLAAVAFVLTVGLLAGIYPAVAISRYKPIKVLKGSFKNSSEGVWLRKSLVVLQLSLSIILLAGATVVYSQLSFLQKYDMGFTSDQMLIVDFGYDNKVQARRQLIKDKLLSHPNVTATSVSRAAPGDFFPNAGTGIADPETGEIVFKSPAIYEIDDDFIPTYEVKMAAGRNFSDDFATDSLEALILNESAARLYGYANPEDIIGKRFMQWGRTGKVIGVVKDFNYVSLHRSVEPLSLRYGTQFNVSVFSLKLKSGDLVKTYAELEETWNEIAPHRPFDTRFVDQSFDKQYQADDRFGLIFTVFSALAIIVASLGLFGLTLYSTSQRAKEIGIRKVLGASVPQIVGLLSIDILKLFCIALIVAVPVSWYYMNSWLNGFAYRITLDYEIFAIAALLTLAAAMLTMSFKTISAATGNPAESLKDE